MINFEFERHEKHNLPEWRLIAIEKQLQKRVTQLLGLAKERKFSLIGNLETKKAQAAEMNANRENQDKPKKSKEEEI
jgi:hypothetical protein